MKAYLLLLFMAKAALPAITLLSEQHYPMQNYGSSHSPSRSVLTLSEQSITLGTYNMYKYDFSSGVVRLLEQFTYFSDNSVKMVSNPFNEGSRETDQFYYYTSQSVYNETKIPTSVYIDFTPFGQIIECQTGSNPLNLIIIGFNPITLTYTLHYYQSNFLLASVSIGYCFRKMFRSGGYIYISTAKFGPDNVALSGQIYQEITLTYVDDFSLSDSQEHSMAVTSNGYFIATFDTKVDVYEVGKFSIRVATFRTSHCVKEVTVLENDEVIFLTTSTVEHRGQAPDLDYYSQIPMYSSHGISDLQLFTFGNYFVLFWNYIGLISLYEIREEEVVVQGKPEIIESKESWGEIIGRLMSAAKCKGTSRKLQPLNIFFDDFELYRFHRTNYTSLISILINEVHVINEVKSKFNQHQEVDWLYANTQNHVYASSLAPPYQTDPNEIFFLFGLKQILNFNIFSTLVVFLATKILHLLFYLLPHNFAFIRYANIQFKKQTTLVIFVVSLLESVVSDGTVFFFGQISLLTSFTFVHKLSLVSALVFFFILFIYVIVAYPLLYTYYEKDVRALLYFTKSNGKGVFLHSITTNFIPMILAFIHSFLFHSYGHQLIALISAYGLQFLILIALRKTIKTTDMARCYILSNFVLVILCAVLYLNLKDSFQAEVHIVNFLVGLLILLLIWKIIEMIKDSVKEIKDDWKQKLEQNTQKAKGISKRKQNIFDAQSIKSEVAHEAEDINNKRKVEFIPVEFAQSHETKTSPDFTKKNKVEQGLTFKSDLKNQRKNQMAMKANKNDRVTKGFSNQKSSPNLLVKNKVLYGKRK